MSKSRRTELYTSLGSWFRSIWWIHRMQHTTDFFPFFKLRLTCMASRRGFGKLCKWGLAQKNKTNTYIVPTYSGQASFKGSCPSANDECDATRRVITRYWLKCGTEFHLGNWDLLLMMAPTPFAFTKWSTYYMYVLIGPSILLGWAWKVENLLNKRCQNS